MLVYNMDIMAALKEKGYTSTRIREEKLLGQDALQKIRHGKIIGIIQLDTLCRLLDCQPGEIIRYVPDHDDTEHE